MGGRKEGESNIGSVGGRKEGESNIGSVGGRKEGESNIGRGGGSSCVTTACMVGGTSHLYKDTL